jgi:molybdate transport system substrate-binding protein
MRRILHAIATSLVLAAACPLLAQSATVRLAAAADLQPVLPSIVADFEKQTGKHVEVSYASSSTLATQILNGAPFDLFLSADLGFAQKITDAGLTDAPVPYAKGTLVLWARKDSPLQPLALDSLRSTKLRRLAVANPDHAPYGRAAKAALEAMHLTQALQSKLIVGENIAQTAQYAESGNVDAGLISMTSAVTSKFGSEGSYIVIPPPDYPPLTQGAVVLKHSPGAAGGQMLLEFLLSPAIQNSLPAHGLQPVN